MVYCPKCGTKNEEDAIFCKKCGESLFPVEEEIERIERRVEKCFGPRERRAMEEECFGLPRGGAILGIVIGLIILLFGISWMLDVPIKIFPIAVIILGILIIAGALYGLSRR